MASPYAMLNEAPQSIGSSGGSQQIQAPREQVDQSSQQPQQQPTQLHPLAQSLFNFQPQQGSQQGQQAQAPPFQPTDHNAIFQNVLIPHYQNTVRMATSPLFLAMSNLMQPGSPYQKQMYTQPMIQAFAQAMAANGGGAR